MNSDTLHVRARRSPSADNDVEPSGFYGSLQWMPAGESTIRATANGKPKKLQVVATAQTAQMVDKRIKEMIAEAHGGKAAQPYIDFDHADGEAAAWAQSASWGGTDPLTGGVRLHVEWSETGRAKVKGKSYQGFSPEFMVNSSGVVIDVGLNLGGLVNRPAFTGIQRVTAAHAGENREFEGEIMAEQSTVNLYGKAARVQAERGLKSLEEAVAIVARENPDLYREYTSSLNGPSRPEVANVKAAAAQALASDFVVRAKELSRNRKIDDVEAARILAYESPELYQQYHASLGLKEPVAVKAKKTSHTGEELEFVVQARELAIAEGIDLPEASLRVARANPKFYDEYVEDLGKPR